MGGMFARMRFTLVITAISAVAACATAPAPNMPETAVAPAAESAQSPGARMLAAAGGADAPTRVEIERIFGQPDLARQDGAGAALTYRLQSCALLLLFETDGDNRFRLAEAHASARRAGEEAPSLDQCAAEIAAR